jgi:DNA-damage-inducible protein J
LGDLISLAIQHRVDNVMRFRYNNKKGGGVMARANINVRTDAAVKAQAQQIFESIGLDLSTAVNLFLKQAVKVNNLPFTVGLSSSYPAEKVIAKRVSRRGIWKDKFSLPEGFDAPLDDFKEYM